MNTKLVEKIKEQNDDETLSILTIMRNDIDCIMQEEINGNIDKIRFKFFVQDMYRNIDSLAELITKGE